MTYDTDLAARIRLALHGAADVTERSMFGGLAFLVGGYMAVVASGRGGMMTRADPAMSAELVATTPAELAVMRGRPMAGWLHLDAAHLRSDNDLEAWIRRAVEWVSTLPPKG